MPKTIDPRIELRIKELRNKAKGHLTQQEYVEALSCLDLAIDLNTSSYKLYRLRSIAHACLGDYRGSAADAEKVIDLAPTIMDGYYHKGFALFNLKQYAEAAHAFQEGLKLNPADKVLRQGFWDAISLVSQSRTEANQASMEALLYEHKSPKGKGPGVPPEL
mmetsp:Transcript_5040/g.10937  ORF Transcript_5040/g.10937 Transcript_5040/m.10937 type:complete len:162 (-) Transcript_5040:659-1144(-)|eukprot:CAMPEP_0202898986 /NCGR_PEP_ID=MMETSP1392-20130828/7355_1 /ASSEMBLY_ACC=CAM_ASM_000868 /TAXON_ID=225041 /ORGANISM="Chlamydomonas chlamydogama, Strain SAG 11-48b" /LENGTH=161 /DNA_ID=CAMNT_0049585067 /DNA_START=127 /DNA_END=612 /DNA_ORIENTATION=-